MRSVQFSSVHLFHQFEFYNYSTFTSTLYKTSGKKEKQTRTHLQKSTEVH